MLRVRPLFKERSRQVLGTLGPTLLALCIAASTSCSLFRRQEPTSEQGIFEKGYRYFERGKNTQAAELFNRLLEQYPRSRYRTRTQILLAEAYFRDKLYEEAKFLFSHFVQLHPAHEDAELAYFRLGDCDFEQMRGEDRDQSFTVGALHAYERALSLYPLNPRRQEVEERVRSCKERLAEHEYTIARFYLKTKRYRSAAERFQFMVEWYPEGELADDALFFLGEAHRRLEEDEDAAQAWNQLISQYPQSRYCDDAEDGLRQIAAKGRPEPGERPVVQ